MSSFEQHKAYLLARCIEDPETGCWNWTLGTNKAGYGTMRISSTKLSLPHRLAYQVFVGELVPGLMVCHTCDNRKCINPKHLVQATNTWNQQDKQAKRRSNNGAKTYRNEAHHATKLSSELVLQIRQGTKTQTAWAQELGVSQSAISRAVNKHTWSNV